MKLEMGDIFGITPARAGRTEKTYRAELSSQDHPRSRGKDTSSHVGFVSLAGSPPLAREGPFPSIGAGDGFRITPARAGRTLPVAAISL